METKTEITQQELAKLDPTTAAKTIKKILQEHFPTTKWSVSKSHGSVLNSSWLNVVGYVENYSNLQYLESNNMLRELMNFLDQYSTSSEDTFSRYKFSSTLLPL